VGSIVLFTVVVAELELDTNNSSVAKSPIPIVGRLFRKASKSGKKVKLIVMVTPIVV